MAVILHEQHIEVAVVDRGHGAAEPERLFEPFFSTKSQGLGMGLNISVPLSNRTTAACGQTPIPPAAPFSALPCLRCTPAAGPE